jgi:cytoskeletal protein CcmA (bactofilin family)
MAESSVIGAGTVVSGHVRGDGSLEILGRVEGDVNVTGNVTIGASGRVRGSINGAQLTIAGHVQGDLRGTLAVFLESGARVAGDISSPRVGIAPGALARGHVQTDGEPAAATRPASATAARPAAAAVRPADALRDPRRAAPAPATRPAPVAAARVAPARPNPPIQPSVAKVPARAEARPEPRKTEAAKPAAAPPAAAAPPETEFVPVRPLKVEPRRPPPPVVPVLGKGVKAKKKKSHD